MSSKRNSTIDSATKKIIVNAFVLFPGQESNSNATVGIVKSGTNEFAIFTHQLDDFPRFWLRGRHVNGVIQNPRMVATERMFF
jgi:hypothetical protein